MKPAASLAATFAVTVTVSLGGCQCNPGIPDAPEEETQETAKPDTAAPHTGETGTPPIQGPCTLTEAEPNNSPADAMLLPTDEYLCGGFDGPVDLDTYRVELAEEGWLGVFVDAQIRGSLADVGVTVTAAGFGVERQDDDTTRDAHLIFPAPQGSYDVLLYDNNLLGGEDFFYELVVSVAKKPVLENATEIEPNDSSDTAMAVTDGMVLLANLEEQNAFDWYRVDVPAGSHAITIDMLAYTAGSPGDFTIFAYPNGLDADPRVVGSRPTGGRDPLLTLASAGNTSVWFRVEEVNGKGGPGYWYALQVEVEAE